MGKKPVQSVNLLEPMLPPQGALTMLYNWVFNVGRVLLVIVQIVVIGVFIFRLDVDRVNNDLTRDINDKIAILGNSEIREEEHLYRKVQSFFYEIDDLDKYQHRNARTIVSILDSLPSDIYIDTISFTNHRVSTEFYVEDFESAWSYETFLKQHPNYYDVNFVLERTGSDDAYIEGSTSYRIRKDYEVEDGDFL